MWEDNGKMNKDKIDIGFIGCGAHATRSIYPCLRYAPINLVATCDLVEERAQANARTFGAQRFYTDYRAMMDQEDLDAIFVIGGPDLHAEAAIEAMRRGLHVFMEKPPARTVESTREVCRVSQETGKWVMVAFKKRFCPTHLKAKEITASSEFGRPMAIHVRLGLWLDKERLEAQAGQDAKPDEARFYQLLLDYYIHHFDLLRFFLGEVDRLYFQRNVGSQRPNYAATLTFRNGAIGTLLFFGAQSPHSFQERLEICGEGANVVVDNVARLTYYRRSASRPMESFISATDEAPVIWEPAFSLSQVRNKVLFIGGFAGEVQHFAQSLLAGQPPTSDIWDGLEAVRLVEAISGQSGEVIVKKELEEYNAQRIQR
jgi:predicted dehydrogenase